MSFVVHVLRAKSATRSVSSYGLSVACNWVEIEAGPERVYVAFCVIMTELSPLSARLLTLIQNPREIKGQITFMTRITFPHFTTARRKVSTDANQLV